MFRRLVPFVVIATLVVAGCGSQPQSEPATPSPAETPKPVIAAEPGEIFLLDANTPIKDQKMVDEEGIRVPGGGEVRTLSWGIVEGVPLTDEDMSGVNWESDTVTDAPEEKTPAEGEAFVAYRLKTTVGSAGAASIIPLVDGNPVQAPGGMESTGEKVVVFSVPADLAEEEDVVSFQISFDGVDQTMLASGKRTSDNASALYNELKRDGTFPKGNDPLLVIPAPRGEATLKFELYSVSRDVWLPQRGWANEGESAWLTFEATGASWGDNDSWATYTDTSHWNVRAGGEQLAVEPVENVGFIAVAPGDTSTVYVTGSASGQMKEIYPGPGRFTLEMQSTSEVEVVF